MSQNQQHVNLDVTLNPATANLLNVSLAIELAEVAINRRNRSLPGVVCYSGHSGLGKSTAADFVALTYRGYYVEFAKHWRKQELVERIMFVMGISKTKELKNLTACIDEITAELSVSNRPLIIDEFDQLTDRDNSADYLEIIRYIAKRSKGSIMLIGEEGLPQKLAKYEKFHNIILDWKQAVTADIGDCQILARHYYPGLEIHDDLLGKTVRDCHGITRRICTNLEAFATEADSLGITSIGLAEWGARGLNTGAPPKVRSLK